MENYFQLENEFIVFIDSKKRENGDQNERNRKLLNSRIKWGNTDCWLMIDVVVDHAIDWLFNSNALLDDSTNSIKPADMK